MEQKFGVVAEPPKDLILRKGETYEWVIAYRNISDPLSIDARSFLIHADTLIEAEKGFAEKFPYARILRIGYYGTYQY